MNRIAETGDEFEILLHMYMYYFDIDNDKGYAHSKVIDIDNGNAAKLINATASSTLINICKKAIKNNKQNLIITKILKMYVDR